MHPMLKVILLLCGFFLWTCESTQPCLSCGPECVSACGSRNYRACCFNYLRKRRSEGPPLLHEAQLPSFSWHVPLSTSGEPSPSASASGSGSGAGKPAFGPQADRDLQVELVVLPQRVSQDGANRFHFARDPESSYEDNVPIGRFLGLTNAPPTPPSSSDGPSAEGDLDETLNDSDGGETNTGARVNEGHREKPQEVFPWIEDNRRRLHLVYSSA